MEDNASRFLSAFVQIEKRLRMIAGEMRYEKFFRLLEEAAKKNQIVKRYEFNLQEFADLRNAIVHQRDGVGEIIAQPTDGVVNEIEEILKLLSEEPKVEQLFLKKVFVCREGDKVLEIETLMREKGYSKIPVVRNRMVVGLLHIEKIAQWACDYIQQTTQKTSVGEIMEDIRGKRNVIFVSKETSVYEIPSLFTQSLKKGNRLEAVFITETGSEKEKLIGIITVKDLPQILECF